MNAPSRYQRAKKAAILTLATLSVPVVAFLLAILLHELNMPRLPNGLPILASVVVAYAFVYPVFRLVRWLARRRKPPRAPAIAWGWLTYGWGVSLVFLVVLPLYEGVGNRSRIAKAQADARTIASALSFYREHCGAFPPPGAAAATCPAASGPGQGEVPLALTLPQTNAQGAVAGPFLAMRPMPPPGWRPYRFVLDSTETFDVCSSGDDMVVNITGTTCP